MAENQHPSIILCPYCGHIQQLTEQKCEACGGFFDRLSLKATQVAMGPWFIHNAKKPFKPGCSYDVIKKQAAAGRIHSRTIMRGPTTRQFWSFAKNVPGVGHLIGYCHNCGQHVTPTDPKCSKCNAPFREVALRNEMGLLYPTIQEAVKAQEQLDKETGAAATKQASGSHPASTSPHAAETAHKAAPGDDLLDEVIGRVEKQTGGKAAPRAVAPAAKSAPSTPAKSAHAAPAPAPAPASAGVELGEIDDEETHTPQAAPKSRGNVLNILFLVLGIILVIAIQVYMLMNLTPAPAPTGNQSQQQDPAPAPPDTDPSTTPPVKPVKPVTPVKPTDPEARPITAPPANTSTTTTPPPVPSAEKKPEKKPETLQERYQQALELEKQKKFKEALAILTEIQNKTPLNQIPKEMVDATRRLQAKVAQQSSAPLFEPP
jgi:hypothetical protein